MFPVFQYEQFVKTIKSRKTKKDSIIFGILIADYRQQACREHILNYLNRFHKLSGNNIDFYIPGYIQDNYYFDESMEIKIGNETYYFAPEVYEEFLENLSYDFDIPFPYNPVLILIEYRGGHFKYSKKISIELNLDKRDIRKTGMLFEKIFDISDSENNLSGLMYELGMAEIKENLFDTIIQIIDNKYITNAKALYDQYKLK